MLRVGGPMNRLLRGHSCGIPCPPKHERGSMELPRRHGNARHLDSQCQRMTAASARQPVQTQQFEALCTELLAADTEELQQRVMRPGSTEASIAFLSWLSDQERHASGTQRQALARLAGDLLLVKEHADWEAARRLLPSLASSLAYSNYADWRAQHGDAEVADVVPGQMTLEDLYKATEREEVNLRLQLSKSSSNRSSSQPSPSTLDSFATQQPQYAEMAAAAMARVRSRLCGYEDGSEAAAAVLEELLHGCCCREERATVLPEAFTPPGLRLTGERAMAGGADAGMASSSSSGSSRSTEAYGRPVPGGGSAASSSSSSSSSSTSSSNGGGAADGRPIYVCTTPSEVLAAVRVRQQQLQMQQDTGNSTGQQPSLQPPALPGEQPSGGANGSSKATVPVQLASGEALCTVLQELAEDIEEYDRHVYQQRSPLDRFGGAGL